LNPPCEPWSEWWIRPGVRTPARERHPERVDDQARAHVGGHRPADDQPRVGVLDGGEVQPPLAGAQIGDVSDPQHVRAIGAELPLDQIARGRDPRDPDRGAPPLAGPDAGDTSGFHQPRDPLAPHADVVLEPELGMDPRRAVHASALSMDLADPLGQPRVLQRAVRRRPTLPVVKSGPAHPEHAAHHGDGKVRLLRSDERVHLAYRPSSSLAKKTAAFRRISRSIRSFAFSSRNR